MRSPECASLSTAISAFELLIVSGTVSFDESKSEAKFDPIVSGFHYFLVNKFSFVRHHTLWVRAHSYMLRLALDSNL